MSKLNTKNYPKIKHPLIEVIIKYDGYMSFSKKIGASIQVVHQWVNSLESGIPPERCVEIEKITFGEITRQQLRPDIFGHLICETEPTSDEKLSRCVTILKEVIKDIYVDKGRLNPFRKPKKGVK